MSLLEGFRPTRRPVLNLKVPQQFGLSGGRSGGHFLKRVVISEHSEPFMTNIQMENNDFLRTSKIIFESNLHVNQLENILLFTRKPGFQLIHKRLSDLKRGSSGRSSRQKSNRGGVNNPVEASLQGQEGIVFVAVCMFLCPAAARVRVRLPLLINRRRLSGSSSGRTRCRGVQEMWLQELGSERGSPWSHMLQ